MRGFSTRCIFCGNQLTSVDRKRGEHIIPQALCGSLCMKDVCTNCNSILGRTADHLILEDKRIIAAVFELDLPELHAKIRDRGRGTFVDLSRGSESQVQFREGKPKVIPQRVSRNLFTCDEREAEEHLLSMLRKDNRHGLKQEEVVRIVRDEVIPRYKRLTPGESVPEPRLGVRLRKSPGRITGQWKVTENAAERLLAKIGYEVASLVFDQERWTATPTLDVFRLVALGQGHLNKSLLMYPRNKYSPVNATPCGPKYHHQIIVWASETGTYMDIYFFGCVGFRLYLRGDFDVCRRPLPHPDGNLDMVSLLMTFDPGQKKKKYIFLKPVGSEGIDEYDVSGYV